MKLINVKNGYTVCDGFKLDWGPDYPWDEALADLIRETAEDEGVGFDDIKLLDDMTAEEIAEALRNGSEWNFDLAEALCAEADMDEEWEARDADTFEAVIEAAADKLGVDIY